jgi:hypothetical protein
MVRGGRVTSHSLARLSLDTSHLCLLTSHLVSMIKIANAPCSWGALEFELEGEAPDYVQVLNEIAETGYAGTELGDWGFMPTEPEKLSQEIHGRNLVLIGAFVPVFLKDPASHQAGIEVAVRTARLMAAVEGKELEKLDYDGWGVVEQDVLPGMGKPKESAKRNREYIRSLGY